MSERGYRRWVGLGAVVLAGFLSISSAQAQQTRGSDDDSGQGGFVVIEDSSAAPPPQSLPAPPTAPVNSAPASAAATSSPTYKPGSAVYPIPYAKPGSTTAASTTAASTQPVTSSQPPATSAANKTAANVNSGTSSEVTPTLVVPSPSWDGEAGSDAKTMLIAWAAKAHWHVQWDPTFTFPIKWPVHYGGAFPDAVAEHYTVYTDPKKTKTPICVRLHTMNHTVHVYTPNDLNKCADDSAPIDAKVIQ